ncbi:hypothetical protein CLOM_g17775 [Closterium sp. NIES-68]|nr:hypothetical protein CLOM_g17775 [Closterium sp. NIES-68]GJP61543.1 hypothetical protein CLOP_g18689 [Closterium sp. NIES-67]
MQVAQLFAAREQAAWVDSAGADAPTSNAPAAPRGVIPLQLPDSDDDRAAAQRRGRSVLSAGSSREYGRADPSDAWRAIAGLDRADGGEKSPRRSPRGRATARQVGQVGLSPRGRPAANMFKRTRGASPREERDEWPASVGASDGAGAGTGMISPRSPAGPKAPLASPPVTPGRGFPSPRTAGALPKSASASASSSGRNRRRDAGLLSPRGNGGELSETRPWRRVDGTGESRFSEERGDAREGESSASSTPRGGVAARRRVPYSLSSPAAVSPPVSPATVLPSPSSDRVAQPLSPVLLPLSALRALRAVCPHCAAELAVAVQIGADGAATLGVEAAAPWEGGGLYDPPPLTPPWRRQPRLRQQAAGKQEELRAENIASPRPRVAGQSASGGVVTKSKAESAKARHRRIHSAIEGLVVDGLAEDGTAEKGTAAEGVAGAVEVDGGEGTSSGPRDAEEGDGGKTSGEDGEGERERAREGTRGLLESMSEGDLSQGGGGSGGESKESAAEADGRGGGVESDGNFGAEGGRGGRRAERGGRRIPLSPALGARRGEPSGQRGGGGQVRRAASPLSIAVGGEGQGQQEEEEGGGGTPNSGGSKAHRRFTTWDGGSSVSAGASMAPWEFVLRRAYRDVGEWFDVREQQLGVGQFGVIRACVRRTTGVTFACKTIRKDCVLVSGLGTSG